MSKEERLKSGGRAPTEKDQVEYGQFSTYKTFPHESLPHRTNSEQNPQQSGEKTNETTTTKPSPCKTNVNPPSERSRRHGVGVWCGRRKVVGVRVDSDLYDQFKPVAKRVFGSVCRPVEAFMASVITMSKDGVNFGNTIRIEGGLHIERNLRPRRNLSAKPVSSQCLWSGCDRRPDFEVWGFGDKKNESSFYCYSHFDSQLRSGHILAYKPLEYDLLCDDCRKLQAVNRDIVVVDGSKGPFKAVRLVCNGCGAKWAKEGRHLAGRPLPYIFGEWSSVEIKEHLRDPEFRGVY